MVGGHICFHAAGGYSDTGQFGIRDIAEQTDVVDVGAINRQILDFVAVAVIAADKVGLPGTDRSPVDAAQINMGSLNKVRAGIVSDCIQLLGGCHLIGVGFGAGTAGEGIRKGITLGSAADRAGFGGLLGGGDPVVACCGNGILGNQNFAALAAVLALGQTGIGAVGRHRGINDLGMPAGAASCLRLSLITHEGVGPGDGSLGILNHKVLPNSGEGAAIHIGGGISDGGHMIQIFAVCKGIGLDTVCAGKGHIGQLVAGGKGIGTDYCAIQSHLGQIVAIAKGGSADVDTIQLQAGQASTVLES